MNEHQLLLAKVQSQQFQAAFERCWNLERKYDVAPNFILGMPALICAAFGIEVGLKALLASFGVEQQREHNLRKLLNALPANVRSEIVADVTFSYPDYEVQLSNAERAFVVWRYFYESKEQIEVNILFVGALGAAVQKQVNLKWESVKT